MTATNWSQKITKAMNSISKKHIDRPEQAPPIRELASTVRRTTEAYKRHQVKPRNRLSTLLKRRHELKRDYRRAIQFLDEEIRSCRNFIRKKARSEDDPASDPISSDHATSGSSPEPG